MVIQLFRQERYEILIATSVSGEAFEPFVVTDPQGNIPRFVVRPAVVAEFVRVRHGIRGCGC